MPDPHPELTRALFDSYRRALTEASYRAPWFAEMLEERHGYDTAIYLVGSDAPSKGFSNLWDRKRLDLTVEALILLPAWSGLFSDELLAKAVKRLGDYGYKFPPESWQPGVSRMPAKPVLSTPIASDLDIDSPQRIPTLVYRILRDTDVARRVKMIHSHRCQICGETILLCGGQVYAEAHHIQPLGGDHRGPDIDENVICVCPNHHTALDYFAMPLDLSKLRCATGHNIGQKFLDYHNNEHAKANQI